MYITWQGTLNETEHYFRVYVKGYEPKIVNTSMSDSELVAFLNGRADLLPRLKTGMIEALKTTETLFLSEV